MSAFTSEQVSRACLFAKEEERRRERTLIFKKIRASDIKLALTWSEWRDTVAFYAPDLLDDRNAFSFRYPSAHQKAKKPAAGGFLCRFLPS